MTKKLKIPPADLNLLKALQRYGIPFVIIGGHAVRFHCAKCDVADLDVLVDPTGRAKDLRAAVNEVLGGDLPPYPVASFGKPYKQIIVKRDGMNSDVLTAAKSVKFAEVYQAAHAVDVEGLAVRVMSKEHLIRTKRGSERDKDIQDIKLLEADATMIEEPSKAEIREVMEEFGVDETDARFIIALDRGEIDGDEVIVEPGEPMPE